eukprot:157728-Rhodomonas_salina.1
MSKISVVTALKRPIQKEPSFFPYTADFPALDRGTGPVPGTEPFPIWIAGTQVLATPAPAAAQPPAAVTVPSPGAHPARRATRPPSKGGARGPPWHGHGGRGLRVSGSRRR